MNLLKLVAVCVTVITIAACGRASEGGTAPTPTPTQIPLPSQPAAGFDVLITDQDRDVAVRAGQKIEVFLRTRPGMTSWNGLRADDSSVLSPVPTGITAVKGATVAGFLAASPGVTNITAYAGPDCKPGQACPAYVMLFQVRVTVVA